MPNVSQKYESKSTIDSHVKRTMEWSFNLVAFAILSESKFQCPMCNQGFKKDWDLRTHLKLKHKYEDEKELERVHQDAEDEIALTKKSMSIFPCALCPKQYSGMTSFFEHTQEVHDMKCYCRAQSWDKSITIRTMLEDLWVENNETEDEGKEVLPSGCNQGFKNDWDLRTHLKLKHKYEDEKELERALQDAEDQIALTKKSMSKCLSVVF